MGFLSSDVQVIAEVGVNHNGNLGLAKKLIESAALAGANWVKFQSFVVEELVVSNLRSAPYQYASDQEFSQFQMLQKYELSFDQQRELYSYARQCGIGFLSSPFDLCSLKFLYSLGVKVFKIASGELTNVPLLRAIGGLAETVILSTGMSYLREIDFAVKTLKDSGLQLSRLVILHCVSQYPTPEDAINLRTLDVLRERYRVPVGFSDHSLGSIGSVAAVARGAMVIEKHITLDRSMVGPDHQASLEVKELKNLVKDIRRVEKLLGTSDKTITEEERVNKRFARKIIVAKTTITEGDVFSFNNLTTKRAGEGLGAELWDSVMGTKAIKDFSVDEPIVF